jgi:hypothetical protein
LQVAVPALDVQQANIQTIDIGSVTIGPITVGDLVVNNVDFAMTGAHGRLQSVSVRISIHVTFDWHIHVGLPDGIPDINIGDSYDLGSLVFGPVNIGDIDIPALNDIHLHIPTLTGQNLSASANPLGLHLGPATADQVHVANAALPLAGFSINGLSLTSVTGSTIAVPAAGVDHASVRHLHGAPIQIPAFGLNNINLPSAAIPNASSSAPLDIPATLSTMSVGFDAGILRAAIHLTPTATSHIDHLEITHASVNATVGQVTLHNVTLPYDALNITLSQLGITSVTVPAFSVS